MSIDYDDDYIDFSLSQQDTLILQRVTDTPPPDNNIIPRTPKRMHLERLPLGEATTSVMRVIKRTRPERLPEYFELTCDWREHDVAVICGSSQLTYQELDCRANRLAHFLISRGVGKGYPIGILLERSLDTYIALLGVLKAGAAFVPIDPSFPSHLMTFIAENAGLRGLLTTSAFSEKTSTLRCPVLELDQAHDALSLQPETRPQIHVAPASLCYILYTLGTSGRPKGVAVSHANIVNFLHAATPVYGVKRTDRVYQGVSIAFDTSFREIWSAWVAGATLVANPVASQRVGHRLTEFLIEHKITVLCCMPTQLATIERDVPSLRTLIIGGETCPPYLVSRWSRPGLRMLNTYGPAETTVMATYSELFPTRPVTIGFPLPTYHVYILDNQFRPVEDGQSGEIYIGGPGVALGYLNLPDLTLERFIPNPVLRDRAVMPRLYRTGDLGRVTPSGEIEYLGRINALMNHSYRISTGQLEPLAFAQANLASFNEYVSVPSFEDRALAEFETSELAVVGRWHLKSIYKKVMTDPLYRNALFSMASTFILGGLGMVFWVIVARLYRAEDVGIATTLISLMTLLSTLTIMGQNVSLNRFLPRSANKNELINSSFFVVTSATVIASTISLLGLQSFSPQLLFLRSNIFYIVSFTLFVVFCSWNTLVESICMAFRSAGNILLKNSIASILKVVLPFALVTFGAYGIFASTASALALGVIISIGMLVLNFEIRPSHAVNVSLIKETLAYSFANYIASFMFTVPSLLLPVIILNVLSAKYAAYYYVASMIQSILQIIPAATAQSLLTEGSYNEAELKKHVKKALTTVFLILVPATAFIVFAGNYLLQFIGKNYANESFQFLQLYSVSTLFTAFTIIANAIMKVKRQVKLLVILNVAGNVLTLWLSYVFISGKLVGIGWGWMLGQAVAGLVSLFFINYNIEFIKR